ncbi:MAG TPA: serine/threonine-protein kinase, partial [Myxococcaceae bacterium]|nr:serine/threonine-protein kinase [Myxococcaceae bacterium]
MRLTRGSQLGPYEVLSTLGSGGMAEVYRARDTRLGRDIALKVVNEALAGDPELVRRFEQEARLAGSLNHPNLVAVYDFGLHEGAPYFITELLKGESLRQRLTRGRIPVDTALDWGAQLAQGLAAAHAQGIVHRDVKPENVFVTTDGHVKLLDFGIAKLVEASRAEGPHGLLDETVTPASEPTRTGAIIGTPAYMAPEQVRGEPVDARTDIFSLGTVLYEMLSGRRPFPGGSLVETGHAILHDEPPRLEGVPAAVDQLVRRCLAKEPEARIQSARDLAFALEMVRGEELPRRPSRAKESRFARWWLWALVLLAGAASGAVLT